MYEQYHDICLSVTSLLTVSSIKSQNPFDGWLYLHLYYLGEGNWHIAGAQQMVIRWTDAHSEQGEKTE